MLFGCGRINNNPQWLLSDHTEIINTKIVMNNCTGSAVNMKNILVSVCCHLSFQEAASTVASINHKLMIIPPYNNTCDDDGWEVK